MKISVFTIGNELLRGATINTNFASIAAELDAIGIPPFMELCAKDDKESITSALDYLCPRSDIIISTGGLGPTSDDITKSAFAAYFGLKMKEDASIRQQIKEKLSPRFGNNIPDSVFNQALIPETAVALDNPHGTAPGIHIHLEKNGKDIFMLPGPPFEALPMFRNFVIPFIKAKIKEPLFSSVSVFVGIPESLLEEKIKHLFGDCPFCNVAYCASPESVVLTLSSTNKDLVNAKMKEARSILAEFAISEDCKNIQQEIIKILRERSEKLAIAESCTGGKISAMITDIPGASDIFAGGITAYSNELKKKFLNVKPETLENFGAVSEQCAFEMSANLAKICGVDAAISVTGIAGPGGGTPEKPVGLVFIGTTYRGKTIVKKNMFRGDRKNIRRRAAATALNQLRQMLIA